MRYTSAPQRREEIVRRLRLAGYVSAPELSADLAVSERTIRRDLQKLADSGLVELVYGGAVPPGGVLPGAPFQARSQVNSAQKKAIASLALQFVKRGATIGIDAGTTTLELARLLPRDHELTVVTYSLPAMAALEECSDITLIGVGGLYHAPTQAFGGPDTVAGLNRMRVHTYFLAASSLTGTGAYCSTPLDGEAKRTFIGVADQVVLLADSSKLHQTAPVPICGYERLDAFVTDDGITDTARSWFATGRTTILVAGA